MTKNIREVFLSKVEVRQNPCCNMKAHGFRERFTFFCNKLKICRFRLHKEKQIR